MKPGWSQSLSGRWETRNFLCLYRYSNPDSSARSLVASSIFFLILRFALYVYVKNLCIVILRGVIPVVLVQLQKFLCITHTVEHKYISPSSTVGTQLHVSALHVGHLQVVI